AAAAGGMTAASLWVATPPYLQAGNPVAALALLEATGKVTRLPMAVDRLREVADSFLHDVEAALEEHPELAEQLKEMLEAEEEDDEEDEDPFEVQGRARRRRRRLQAARAETSSSAAASGRWSGAQLTTRRPESPRGLAPPTRSARPPCGETRSGPPGSACRADARSHTRIRPRAWPRHEPIARSPKAGQSP